MNAETNIWLERAVGTVSLISCIYVLRREYRHRKTQISTTNINKYQKMLNIWSLLCMIVSVLSIIVWLLGTIPSICVYGYKLGNILLATTKSILNFYQIARLQYCFLDKQVHSKKYGYPNCLFIILYSVGTFYIIGSWITLWIATHYVQSDYSCVYQPNSSFAIQLILINTASYLILD
eukprot:41041_1